MIRLFQLDSTVAHTLASVAGAFLCAAVALSAALPLATIA